MNVSQQTIIACDLHAQAADYWRVRAAESEALRMRLVEVFYVLTVMVNTRLP